MYDNAYKYATVLFVKQWKTFQASSFTVISFTLLSLSSLLQTQKQTLLGNNNKSISYLASAIYI